LRLEACVGEELLSSRFSGCGVDRAESCSEGAASVSILISGILISADIRFLVVDGLRAWGDDLLIDLVVFLSCGEKESSVGGVTSPWIPRDEPNPAWAGGGKPCGGRSSGDSFSIKKAGSSASGDPLGDGGNRGDERTSEPKLSFKVEDLNKFNRGPGVGTNDGS